MNIKVKKDFFSGWLLGSFLFLVTLIWSRYVHADSGLPILTQLTNKIPTDGTILVVGSFVIETLMRLWPTGKPASIIYTVAAVCHQIGNLANAAGGFLDKILPQNVTPTPTTSNSNSNSTQGPSST
jgi:hypothetical protein